MLSVLVAWTGFLTLLTALRLTHIHTHAHRIESDHPGKQLAMKFSKKIRDIVEQAKGRARQLYQPACGFSPEYPIINLEQS